MVYKVVLWGLGALYNKMLNIIRYNEDRNQVKIAAVTANILPKMRTLDGYPVVLPSELNQIEYEYIIVLNEKWYFDIINEAVNKYKICRDKFISYKVFWIPNLNFEEYIWLKNSKISIISNNCWGGIAYSNLGLECLSPFKNCFLLDADYITVVNQLELYLSYNLVFSHWDIDVHNNQHYPVMKLGDVYIHFNHASGIEEAEETWERRKKRLNYDNIFIEMYTEDPKIEKDFSKIDQYNKKVCFVPWRAKYNSSMKLELYTGHKEFYQTVNRSAGLSGLKYDLVKLLLYGKRVLRYG
ncbi:MAG: DUF1919 domain-containing protein [Hungatella sp.]|nr:DUF1919 domain-containing protein [Hungatella sp.]